MTRAAERTDEWTSSLQATCVAASPRSRARSRAACSAEMLPFVPPWTKQPPASGGMPARSASQRRASFSAWTAPAPSIHDPAYTEVALTSRSISAEAGVGAEGMNAR
jgi:hypothetical protein